MVIKAIFFDFDGTISDAKKIAHNSVVKVLDEFEYKFSDKKLRDLMGIKMHLILKGLGVPVKDVEKVRKRFYKYFTEAAVAGGIKPCVSLNSLWELKKDYPLIVVSNSKSSFLKASIKKLKLKGLFKKIYGADNFSSKDDLLERLFRKMKIKPSEAIYIGDRFSDVEFAREAGCVAVAIHNKCSWSTLAQVRREKPDYIVRDFYGLKKIVRSLE
jgi:phosphoglycolate phosphatase-like HAD superfamily hydrolase